MTVDVDIDLVTRICRDATSRNSGTAVLDVMRDPLDGSVWVSLTSWPRAREARDALAALGLASRDGHHARLHVTGWDARLLRRRLAILLAGIDDLSVEWDATAELANYCYDRRAVTGDNPNPADVLADVEATMRRAVPLPHQAPHVVDVADLLNLINDAEDAYERLIGEHLDHAEAVLLRRRSALGAA